MIEPPISRVSERRYVALACIRIVGGLMLIVAVIKFILALQWWLNNASRFTDVISFLRYGVHNDLMLAFLIPGVLLLLFGRRIARWLVPLPRQECPQCGYWLRELTSKRCPECGLTLRESGPSEQSQA